VRADRAVAPKPSNVTFEQASAVPVAAVSALQALRDKAHLRAGQTVLVNGAGGGVGTFAVQLAKAYGAEVTAVTRTANLDLVRSLGADHVVDYTRDDFTRGARRYDVVLDMSGTRGPSAIKRALTPKGVLVQVGAVSMGNWVAPLLGPLRTVVTSLVSSQTLAPFLATVTRADLDVLSTLMAEGKVTSVVDRTYPLADVAAAVAYLETGHATGKVVVTL
jgi:NADPH:quinone reductase-like Zn-dependent oxidoreductase